jgi:hypothetical protein
VAAHAQTRRAAVYRAIGRAARIAREDGDATVPADLRIAMTVLRMHARARPTRATAKRKRR